jgi:hypothetical protein
VAKAEKLPDDLRELCGLCREGRLFAVQEWLKSGKRFQPPQGNYRITPFSAAIETGFHSLIEIFLRAGIDQEEKDRALDRVTSDRKPGLVELLHKYGADPLTVAAETIIGSGHPVIIRWFVNHGMDLETGNPITYAFRWGRRGFLGIYLEVRDRVPSASRQAAMALRYHAGEGSLKWVSLLLWAGVDPRLEVPSVDSRDDSDDEDKRSALSEAVLRGKVDVVEKFRPDPSKDDCGALLRDAAIACNPELMEMVLRIGNAQIPISAANEALETALHMLCWRLDPSMAWGYYGTGHAESVLKCIGLLGAYGARWNPSRGREMTSLRKVLAKIGSYEAVRILSRIVEAKTIDQPVLAKFLSPPKMKEILGSNAPGVVSLRHCAGLPHSYPRRTKDPCARTIITSRSGTGGL